MCGISGVINQFHQEVKKDEIKKINDLISHRGPDDEGFFFKDNFAFGHRRLSILDLSVDGHQPMHYLEKYTLTYNGEIYNYLELKEELVAYGYCFNSQTDTEVILASYDRWGEECVRRFNGMWAFALYDKTQNRIFCSRDRFGIKPFYYTEVNEKFVFGSEIKQLLEFYPDRYVNKNILMDYLVIGYENHSNETFFESIFSLSPSHNLLYDLKTNVFTIKPYYDIFFHENLNSLNEKESIERYKKVLSQSIKLRLRSDVKVGTCLSGGLDSSCIAGMASKAYASNSEEKFMTIHAKSTQANNDESAYAKEVAEYCDLDLNIVEPTLQQFKQSIDEVIYTQEEPFGSPSIFMQYFVMQEAKKRECKVLLDGQGGDETLFGYERYYPSYLFGLGFFKRLGGILRVTKNSKLSIRQLISYMLYFTNAKVRLKRLKKRSSFVKKEYLEMMNQTVVQKNAKNYLDIMQLQYMEIYQTQMPHLLRYEDRNSMRNSIETRLPFIDFNVLEVALSIHNDYKVKEGWSKYILRKVMNPLLPKTIVWRKHKLGFEAPTQTWLESLEDELQIWINNSKIIQEIINQQIEIKHLTAQQQWRLFNIAKWESIYSVKIKN